MEVNEKRCFTCGRIGTRNFVPLLEEDRHRRSPFGPWQCEFEPACTRRYFARIAARERAEADAAQALGVEPVAEPAPVDLDDLQQPSHFE